MDVQHGIADRFHDADYLPRLGRTIGTARAASDRNRSFSAIAAGGRFVIGDPAEAVHPYVAPEPGEVVVTKRRVSSFSGSDLEVVLRAGNTDTLVPAGIVTGGVALSTHSQAADLDYRLAVLADGCLDSDPEVHRVVTKKVFPRQADVLSSEQWVEQIGHRQY